MWWVSLVNYHINKCGCLSRLILKSLWWEEEREGDRESGPGSGWREAFKSLSLHLITRSLFLCVSVCLCPSLTASSGHWRQHNRSGLCHLSESVCVTFSVLKGFKLLTITQTDSVGLEITLSSILCCKEPSDDELKLWKYLGVFFSAGNHPQHYITFLPVGAPVCFSEPGATINQYLIQPDFRLNSSL